MVPLPPAEMAVWLTSVKVLLDRAEKRDAHTGEITRIDDAVRAIVPALEALADEIGQPRTPRLLVGFRCTEDTPNFQGMPPVDTPILLSLGGTAGEPKGLVLPENPL